MSDLTLLQASVLSSEISLAKNYATRSIHLVNNLTNEVAGLRQDLYHNDGSLNIIISKLQHLCNILVTQHGFLDASYNTL